MTEDAGDLFRKENLIFADLHIHSRFSRACSKNLNLENLEKWARIKGIGLLGTGDFTHPEWLRELKDGLTEKKGILYSKSGFRFVLSGEVSLMYTQERGRRIHLVVLAPDFEIVDRINSYLDGHGRRDYDGRPIFKISCEEFTRAMNDIDDRIEVIPAHVWTPYFGVFGSESGFDSLKEAFGSSVEKIHAIETGISSTPRMNLRLEELQGRTIVSFSDSHSFWPWRLGRECTIFSSCDSYNDILNAVRSNRIVGTVEVNPAYGKYHYDGHRNCEFSCSPGEFEDLQGVCPVCRNFLLRGVDHRVEDLASFPEGDKSDESKIVYEILPLHELIATSLCCGINSKRVWNIYNHLINEFENEFNILLFVSSEKLANAMDDKLLRLVVRNREGRIKVKPGYDGVYGKMILEERQETLF